jgi:hypothetical protein
MVTSENREKQLVIGGIGLIIGGKKLIIYVNLEQ